MECCREHEKSCSSWGLRIAPRAQEGLAGIRCSREQYQESVSLHHKAIEGLKASVGDDNSEPFTAMEILGLAFCRTKVYEEAQALFELVPQWNGNQYAKEHSYTLRTLQNQGLCFNRPGEYWKALLVLERALNILERLY